MKQIIGYFIKYPVSGNVLMLLIIVFGYFGLISLKSTLFPEVESRNISIQVVYPGASPEEIEEGIILKIEDNLKGVTGVERVSSVSQENAGTITVEVLKGYDTDLIVQDVKNAVDRIPSFPSDMEPPTVFKQENLNFAYSFAITGPVDLKTLKEFARRVETDILAIDGISKVALSGFPEEEIEIAFREADLLAYNLTFTQATQAVRTANIEITGGKIKTNREEYLIRARSKEYFAEGLKDIIVKADQNGNVVRLMDVADVYDRWSDVPDRNYLDGDPSVVVTIQNTINEDVLFITDEMNKYVEQFNQKNETVKAEIIRDGSITLRQRIDLLSKNGIIGFMLVLIVLAFFLNLRLAFWVAISIPISMMGMFILASFYGLTINVMSLFGMILVIGILVDDGIVIGENIYQHYENGKSAYRAAIDGTLEVFSAVVSAVVTTIIAFSTFFFLDGRLGDFAPALAFVVMATLAISLLEGALILPGHIAHSKSLQGKIKKNAFERFMDGIMSFLRDRIYKPFLIFAMKNMIFTLAIPTALFLITVGSISGGIIGVTFFPFIERDDIAISIEMAPGTRDNITESVLNKIEAAAWRVNKKVSAERADSNQVVLKIQKKLGPGSNKGNINVTLLDGETRGMQSFFVANLIRDEVGPLPEVEKASFGSASPFGKPVSVSLLGNNLNELESAKQDLQKELENLASLKDVVDNDQKGIREVNIELKEKAKLLGLTLQDVVSQVRQGFFGSEVQRLQRGVDEVKVWVRYKEQERSSLTQLEDMRIRLADGREIPLHEVATYEVERGVVAINHLDGKREIRIEADLANPDKESVPDILANVEEVILPPILAKYPSISYTFEGQSRQQAKVFNSVKKVVPIILLLMFAVIVLTFRSIPQGLLIYMLVPLGLIGVGWGHWVHGAQISLLSFFGIIGLIGIMVNDSLVFVTAFNRNIKSGMLFGQAILDAGLSRFRPILLTSVTTIAGLAPLILEKSFQAQFLIPMAISIGYGLIAATFTTLVALPLGLILFNRVKVYALWLWEGKKPSPESVEPAYQELEFEHEA